MPPHSGTRDLCSNFFGKWGLLCAVQPTCQSIRLSKYISVKYRFNRDLSKGSAELLVLTLLEGRPRHGYDLGKLIEERTKGQIRFRIGSLYPGGGTGWAEC